MNHELPFNSCEDLAQKIRENGKKLLDNKKIVSFLQELGELYFTGSFSLDLMTWNDIDMQIILKEGIDPIPEFCRFAEMLGNDPDLIEFQLINFTGKYKPKMPRGVYMGIKIDSLDHGGMWKLDLWSLAKADFNKNRELIEKLAKELTPEDRSLILNLKHELMKKSGRVPQMGSHFLYQAVLVEKLKERDLIFDYMVSQGVVLD
jgi:hypothetical protein